MEREMKRGLQQGMRMSRRWSRDDERRAKEEGKASEASWHAERREIAHKAQAADAFAAPSTNLPAEAPPSSHSLSPADIINTSIHRTPSFHFIPSPLSPLATSEAQHSVAFRISAHSSAHSSEPSIAKTLRSEYTFVTDKSPSSAQLIGWGANHFKRCQIALLSEVFWRQVMMSTTVVVQGLIQSHQRVSDLEAGISLFPCGRGYREQYNVRTYSHLATFPHLQLHNGS